MAREALKELKPLQEKVSSLEVSITPLKAAVDSRFEEVEEKIKFVRGLMYYMVVVLLVGFILAIIAYFQFVADINRDYKNAIEQLNNQKLQLMQNQIDKLSTQSAK